MLVFNGLEELLGSFVVKKGLGFKGRGGYDSRGGQCRLVFVLSFPQPTHLRPMFQSYNNQSIDFQSKSIDWFLYHENIDR